jgi:hypothetical protein
MARSLVDCVGENQMKKKCCKTCLYFVPLDEDEVPEFPNLTKYQGVCWYDGPKQLFPARYTWFESTCRHWEESE